MKCIVIHHSTSPIPSATSAAEIAVSPSGEVLEDPGATTTWWVCLKGLIILNNDNLTDDSG